MGPPPVSGRVVQRTASRELMVKLWHKINQNEIWTRASAVAFYAVLATVPFLGLLLAFLVRLLPDLTHLAGARNDQSYISVGDLENVLQTLFPDEMSQLVKDQIAHIQEQWLEGPPIWLFAFGIGSMLWLSSSLYTAIIDAINRIQGIEETRSIVKVRLMAILMTIIQSVILLTALVLIVLGPEVLWKLGVRSHAVWFGSVARVFVVWIIVLLSFALSFHVAPCARRNWKWISPGSVSGSIAFMAATYLFRVYVQNFANYNKTYGSLGGVMMLAFWFWVSSAVLLLAAQLDQALTEQNERRTHC
jgi:membrane protein